MYVDGLILYLQDSESVDLRDKLVFAQLVKRGRNLNGMSLREVASEVGSAPGTISRWENGHCAPPLVSREAVINFFRKTLLKNCR